jgi:hypothetical protein
MSDRIKLNGMKLSRSKEGVLFALLEVEYKAHDSIVVGRVVIMD